MSSKKKRNHYDLKEMENIKNAKIVSIAWNHNILTEMFTITEKPALLYEKVNFYQPKPKQASSSAANFLQINSAWYNLKSRGRFFVFKKTYSCLDIGKVKKYMGTAYMHLFKSRVQLYSIILGFYQQRV